MRFHPRHIMVFLVLGALAAWAAAPPAKAFTVGNADRIGRWAPAFEETPCTAGDAAGCPPVSQAMAALSDGRIFYFQGVEDGRLASESGPEGSARFLHLGTGAARWSVPETGGPAALPCADVAQLADGRLLVVGGSPADPGVPVEGRTTRSMSSSWIVDPSGSSLRTAAPLRGGRSHSSLVTLADGSLLAAGGSITTTPVVRTAPAVRTETFDPAAGSWTENYTGPASESALPALPQLFLMPNGKVFYGGAGHSDRPQSAAVATALDGIQQFFDPATSAWELVGPSPWGARRDATSVMLALNPPYHNASVLIFGGDGGTGSSVTSASTLATVDRAGKVQNALTGGMQHARSSAVAVPLPDGTVLALGGAGLGAGPEDAAAELFVPGAERETQLAAPARWFEMASPLHHRTNHHAAVLLADGRVLLGGHAPGGRGLSGASAGPPDASFEMFTPPYLFRSRTRPTIRAVPESIAWGEGFDVDTAQALGIESVVLMRLASPQHSTDSDVRTLRLAFSRASGRLRATAPPNGAVAPPGYYYLFINQMTPKGPVPSVASIVRLGPG